MNNKKFFSTLQQGEKIISYLKKRTSELEKKTVKYILDKDLSKLKKSLNDNITNLTRLKKFNPIKSTKLLILNTQNLIEERLKSDKEEVNLSKSVIWANSIMITLISGTMFGIGWLAVAKTDEIVVVQGKLETISGVAEIQMPLQGIAKKILVKEGQFVQKNQLLIELDPEINLSKKISLNETLDINQNILEKLNSLVKEGAVSELQYLEQKNRVSDIKSQIKENEILLNYQLIKSPISGKVFDLKALKAGFVGRTSEPIMKIVPNDNLKATVDIESRQIGFVNVGQKVEISIDSFPATDFGVIDGEISRVSSEALKPDPQLGKGLRYPANIKLNTQKLTLKSGKVLPLQTGMSLTANIKLRKVSYLRLLLGTFNDKAKSIQKI